MAINPVALKAYTNPLTNGTQETAGQASGMAQKTGGTRSFSDTIKESLGKVNDLQGTKDAMIKSFASGERQNVHELMISLQKAGMAMRMTSAVRNKVLEGYKELVKMQF
ncbi:flagellar hook-basal body complex protein FliE [Desulfoplanes formicivorans]|uniref:Flagellar hook-basal body complex protein FliE n=1 Tax=Desulfoplanes formicivorans TaxID=1592317 RepID=A0A194AFF0_9BACT|nr:flagellar hook-basal body complex protein FliE [Desulfoplanes formicivorans]GAU08797.1 flagellar basal body protein FliE [Desulfoplanes formicivorans]